MTQEIPLKLKYRISRPRGNGKTNYSGNSGSARRKSRTVPLGLRKVPKQGAKKY